jgi:hypothetical protein
MVQSEKLVIIRARLGLCPMPSRFGGADWPPWPDYFPIPAIGESSVRSAMFVETPAHRTFLKLRQERHVPGRWCAGVTCRS